MPGKIEELLAGRPTGYFANKGLVILNFILLLAQVSSYATGFDGSMMNGLQSLTPWQDYFNHPSGSVLGLFNCIQPVGQILSFPIEAYFSDKYGRRMGMAAGAFIILVGCILQGAAINIGMFIAARGLIGFGLGINITAAPVYILETAFPSHRGPLTALYNSLWGFGSLLAAWITYGTFLMSNDWSWRTPSLLQAFSSVLQILLVWFIPESPRWLVENGRIEQATAVLVKYHTNGDVNDPLVELEMAEIMEAIEQDRIINHNVSWMTLFRNKANMKRTALIVSVGFFSQLDGGGIISYYLSLILNSIGYTDSQQQLLINGILQAYGLVLGILFAFVVNRFSRRLLFNISTMGMFATFVVWTLCEALYDNSSNAGDPNPNLGRAVLACIFIFNFFGCVGWTPLQVVYCIEILPISIRARGLAVYNLSVSLAGIVGQYLNPVGLGSIGWKYYVVYDVWLVFIVLVVYFCYPETNGVSLEEVAAMFDGDEVVENIAQKGTVATVATTAIDEKPNSEVEVVAVA